MKRKTLNPKPLARGRSKPVGVDLKTICTIDHACVGCSEVSKSCCAKYDVCVTEEGLDRIIPVLPEVSEYCPHLKTDEGYANVFEEAEKGLYAIDTHENGLCVFAYETGGKIRCSLHSVEDDLGLPRGSVKPEVCILWPLTFSERGNVLTLHDDALGCECSSLRKKASDQVSPALLETIQHFGGKLPPSSGS